MEPVSVVRQWCRVEPGNEAESRGRSGGGVGPCIRLARGRRMVTWGAESGWQSSPLCLRYVHQLLFLHRCYGTRVLLAVCNRPPYPKVPITPTSHIALQKTHHPRCLHLLAYSEYCVFFATFCGGASLKWLGWFAERSSAWGEELVAMSYAYLFKYIIIGDTGGYAVILGGFAEVAGVFFWEGLGLGLPENVGKRGGAVCV